MTADKKGEIEMGNNSSESNVIEQLLEKRKILEEKITKIDTAIEVLRSMEPPPVKAWVTRKGPGAEIHQLEVPDVRLWAKDYIRKEGKECSLRVMFDAYWAKLGKKWKSDKERNVFYQRFYQSLCGASGKRNGFTHHVYKLDGVGREAYVNVDSAVTLQTEKQIVGQTITEVRH